MIKNVHLEGKLRRVMRERWEIGNVELSKDVTDFVKKNGI